MMVPISFSSTCGHLVGYAPYAVISSMISIGVDRTDPVISLNA